MYRWFRSKTYMHFTSCIIFEAKDYDDTEEEEQKLEEDWEALLALRIP